MEKARYGSPHGPLVDGEEFLRRASPEYKEKGILPYCDACQAVVHLYGAHSPNPETKFRFDHPNFPSESDPLDDCVLANRSKRFHGLQPDGYDDVSGRKIRELFFEPDFLSKSYSFCLKLCRNGNLPAQKFQSMLTRAEKKRIWSYEGIQVWAVPYILLTLENFHATSKSKHPYEFHFVFQKPRGTNVSALWTRAEECRICKVFSSSGENVQTKDNPYPVSEADFLKGAGETAWITLDLLLLLIPQSWKNDRDRVRRLASGNQT